MQAIINTDITTEWTDIEIDKTRVSGKYAFWTRGGAAFRVKKKGEATFLTMAEGKGLSIDNVSCIEGVLFQAQTVEGTDTIEVVITG